MPRLEAKMARDNLEFRKRQITGELHVPEKREKELVRRLTTFNTRESIPCRLSPLRSQMRLRTVYRRPPA